MLSLENIFVTLLLSPCWHLRFPQVEEDPLFYLSMISDKWQPSLMALGSCVGYRGRCCYFVFKGLVSGISSRKREKSGCGLLCLNGRQCIIQP